MRILLETADGSIQLRSYAGSPRYILPLLRKTPPMAKLAHINPFEPVALPQREFEFGGEYIKVYREVVKC